MQRSISRHLLILYPSISCVLPLVYLDEIGGLDEREEKQSQDYEQRDSQMESLTVSQSLLPILPSCFSISQWEMGVSGLAK